MSLLTERFERSQDAIRFLSLFLTGNSRGDNQGGELEFLWLLKPAVFIIYQPIDDKPLEGHGNFDQPY